METLVVLRWWYLHIDTNYRIPCHPRVSVTPSAAVTYPESHFHLLLRDIFSHTPSI